MDYKKELDNMTNKILSIKNFDIESFVWNYKRMVTSIYHFHNVIGKTASSRDYEKSL